MSIYRKLLLYISLTAFLMSTSVLGVIGYLNHQNLRSFIIRNIELETEVLAQKTKTTFDRSAAQAQDLVVAAHSLIEMNPDQRKRVSYRLFGQAMQHNPQFSAAVLMWELNAIDSSYLSPYGRFVMGFSRNGTQLDTISRTLDLESENLNTAYYGLKTTQEAFLIPPKRFVYQKGQPDVFITTMGYPIVANKRMLGAVQVDIDLSSVQQLALSLSSLANAELFIVSHNGTFVAHTTDSLLASNISLRYADAVIQHDLLHKIKVGEPVDFQVIDLHHSTYCVVRPFYVQGIRQPWAVGIAVPLSTIVDQPLHNLLVSYATGFVGILVLGIGIFLIVRRFIHPLRHIHDSLEQIAAGTFIRLGRHQGSGQNEIERIYQSLGKLVENLRQKMIFAQQMGKGNYDSEFQVSSTEDELGVALIELRQSLKRVSEEQAARRVLEERETWASRGFNAFNELLSTYQQNFEHFTKETIVWLTKYVQMAIGGLYLIEEGGGETSLRLYASHNYIRENKRRRKIPLGEGLVGRCVQETEVLYLTDLPDEYLKISSGLGEDKARYLLLVPLHLNKHAYGVIEMGSFHEIPEYKIDFVKRIAENIAATVMTLRSNTQTAELFAEHRRQAEEMQKRERNAKTRIDELSKENQVLRHEGSLSQFAREAYFKNISAVEIHADGTIVRCNDRFELYFGYLSKELAGRPFSFLIPADKPVDLLGFINQAISKRTLRREMWLRTKMGLEKNVMTYWSFIQFDNQLWFFIQIFEITPFKALADEHLRTIQTLRTENETLRRTSHDE